MSFSVYLSDREISYIDGEAKKGQLNLRSCGKIELEEGCIVDGRIVDEEQLIQQLTQLKGIMGKEEADLLLDSSAVVTRAMYLPIMSETKIMSVVKQELQDFVEKNKPYVYDYSVLEERSVGNDEKGRVFCSAIERTVLETYLTTFKNAGIKLRTVDVDKSAQMRLVENHPVLKDKTFILCVLDGKAFMASLYVAGKFTYINEFKLTSQRDNLGLISELSRILATFVQFNKAQRTKHEVKNIYFCGMTEMETGFCPNISNNLSIKCELIPALPFMNGSTGNYSLANYIHTTGNLFRK